MFRLLTMFVFGLWGCQGNFSAPPAEASLSATTTPGPVSLVELPTPVATPTVNARPAQPSPTPVAAPLAIESPCAPTTSKARVTFGTQSIPVDLAWTPETRAKGLSGRPCLARDTGLVIGWDIPTPARIWMPDMNFAIDVIFVRDEKVIAIYPDAQPCLPGENCFSFGPQELSDYVLEVPAGSVASWKLKVGDAITLKK